MSLFSKKPAPVIETSYQDVVDYLTALSQQDYTKILKVVTIYRDADKGVKKVLGIKENRVTDPDTADDLAAAFLSEDDTSIGNFLDDDHDTPASRKQSETAKTATKPKGKKIEVKQ